jgi:hypothetical protein
MSYFIIDEEQMKEPVKKVRDHRGENNPHYGHAMQPASKNAISRSQRARYDFYKKAAANIMTEDRVREIIKETVQDYLANNAIQTNNNRPNNIPL